VKVVEVTMASRRKGRTVPAHEIRTGDVVLTPSATTESTVVQVAQWRDEIHVTYAHGTAAMKRRTPVRIYRSSRTVNHDASSVVFSAG
jgi:hypothetical protein